MTSRIYYSEEARNRALMERSVIAAVCIALGVTIGTILALLFAPQEGNDTRRELVNKADDLRHDAEKKLKEFAS